MWSDLIEGVSPVLLKKYFKRDSPLGPISARSIIDRPVLELLTEREIVPDQAENQRPSIIIGRKGSGKTSYLRRLGLLRDPAIFIELKTEKTLNLILGMLSRVLRDSVSVESVASIWEGIFWNSLFWRMNRTGRPLIGHIAVRDHLRSLEIADCSTIEQVISVFGQKFERIAKQSDTFAVDRVDDYLTGLRLEVLKQYAISDLARNGQAALLILDSLDDYPIDLDVNKKALAGLLKCAGEFNAVESSFDLRLCLPAELYIAFTDEISTNAIKDFASKFVIRWPVDELLLAACRRIMIHLYLNFPDFYAGIKANPLETKRDADALLDTVLPKFTTNLNGFHENSVLYLLRHTQLMPRQLILLLSEIFKLSGNPTVSEDNIRLGIRDTEGLIVQEIFTAYRQRYPLAKEVCKAVIPTLEKAFTSDQLSSAVKFFSAERGNIRTAAVKRLLVEIGAIGKVEKEDSSYVVGRFEYTMPSQLPIGAQDKLCVHPLFCRDCESRSRGQYDPPILPFARAS